VKPASPNAGFSLVEVMVAVLILGIALVGLTQGISTALGSNKESELQSTAALLAAGRIELLRAEGDFTDGVTEGQETEGMALYKWKQTISTTATEGLHEISVEVQHATTGQPIYSLQTMLFLAPPDATPDKPGSGTQSARSKAKSKSKSKRRAE